MIDMQMPRHIGEVLKDRNIKLIGADALTLHGFTQVPNAVLRCGEISPGAKLAYTMLLSYAWHNDFCFPGQERLASDMGVTRQSANTYIKELERKAFIKVARRGQGKPNLYEVNLKAKVLGRSRID
ncbi:MAG: helix-turn-helix domain-containing protein [Alphaproteobacteria bacterium]